MRWPPSSSAGEDDDLVEEEEEEEEPLETVRSNADGASAENIKVSYMPLKHISPF